MQGNIDSRVQEERMIMYFYHAPKLAIEALRFLDVTKIKPDISRKVAGQGQDLPFYRVNQSTE
jgi:hypothetical protein